MQALREEGKQWTKAPPGIVRGLDLQDPLVSERKGSPRNVAGQGGPTSAPRLAQLSYS